MADRGEHDAVRFDSQKINWTLREFDRYSSAFAFGLIEAGFERGDRLVMYVDQHNSAESLVLQMGAIKAGVSLVSFAEKESQDALDHALSSSNAKGLVFSPSTQTGEDVGTTRQTFLKSLMPELDSMYAGQELDLSRYPHLRHVVQTGFSNIRGVNMFKDVAVYANPQVSNYSIPENSADDVTHICLRDGKEVSSLTSG